MSTEKLKLKEYANLKYYNAATCLAQSVSGFFILHLSNGFSFPITTTQLNRNAFSNLYISNTQEIIRLPLAPTIAAVLFISSLAHFLLILPRVHNWYLTNLKKGVNYMRWMEYSFSYAIMIVLIAMLGGIYDLSSLIMIFFLNSTMILFRLLSERLNIKDFIAGWTAFGFSVLVGLLPWVVISLYVIGGWASQASTISEYALRTMVTIFIFFNCFTANALLGKLKIGLWKNYLFVEKAYIALSFLSKSALAWQVFYGTLL